MINRPQFKSCFYVEIVETVGVFLLAESDYFVLTGHLYELIAPLLNGKRTPEEIVDLLEEQVSPAEVYYVLMLMEQKGYIVERDEEIPSEIAAFYSLLNVTPQLATERLRSTKVAVTSYGNVPTAPLISLLESLNIQVGDAGELAVVLTDDYLQEGLDAFNRQALESQRPWILIKPVGAIIWLGPIFIPGKTGCWQCLAQRLGSNRPVETFIQKQKNISRPLPTSIAAFPAVQQTGLNLAASEIAKWIVRGENQALEGTLVTWDMISLKKEDHALVKRPQCPECGEPQYKSDSLPVPVVLESRKKVFTADGGHRTSSPEETMKKYKHHISTLLGAVREIKPQLEENPLTPIYAAGHNFATMFDSLYFLRENLRGRSGGKGKSDAQAKASALCEAIERYSGVFQGYEPRQRGTYKEMGDRAIHPNACMHFSEEQYRTRAEWNASCPSAFQKVTEPFDEEREIEWTPVWSLTDQDWKFLPMAYCYYGYEMSELNYCMADSNGCAAGNSKEEAILQGFMELAERDSVSIWWYNRLKRPGVDLDSFDEPYFRALKEYYRTIDRSLWVLDITIDLKIPAFVAISSRTDNGPVDDILYGLGAHFDPKIAIMRALTEVNQTLPAVKRVKPDGTTEYYFKDQLAIDWWQQAKLASEPYLVPDENSPAKRSSDYPQLAAGDLRDDVMNCVKIAEQLGMETLVLDQTRPDLGLNVVKAIVPEMRIFWKRWGSGRLYDVPVKLSWLPSPRQENELNPFPIFF